MLVLVIASTIGLALQIFQVLAEVSVAKRNFLEEVNVWSVLFNTVPQLFIIVVLWILYSQV